MPQKWFARTININVIFTSASVSLGIFLYEKQILCFFLPSLHPRSLGRRSLNKYTYDIHLPETCSTRAVARVSQKMDQTVYLRRGRGFVALQNDEDFFGRTHPLLSPTKHKPSTSLKLTILTAKINKANQKCPGSKH